MKMHDMHQIQYPCIVQYWVQNFHISHYYIINSVEELNKILEKACNEIEVEEPDILTFEQFFHTNTNYLLSDVEFLIKAFHDKNEIITCVNNKIYNMFSQMISNNMKYYSENNDLALKQKEIKDMKDGVIPFNYESIFHYMTSIIFNIELFAISQLD